MLGAWLVELAENGDSEHDQEGDDKYDSYDSQYLSISKSLIPYRLLDPLGFRLYPPCLVCLVCPHCLDSIVLTGRRISFAKEPRNASSKLCKSGRLAEVAQDIGSSDWGKVH